MRSPARLTRPTRTAAARLGLAFLVGLVGSVTFLALPDFTYALAVVLVGFGVIGLVASVIDPRLRSLVAAWLGATTVFVLQAAPDPDVDLYFALGSATAWPIAIGFLVGAFMRRLLGRRSGTSWLRWPGLWFHMLIQITRPVAAISS